MPHCIPLPFLSFCSSERTSPFLRPTLRHDSPRCLYRDFLYDLQRTTRLSLPLFGGGGARRNLLFPLVISARPFAREDPTSLARKISAIVRKRRENFRFELRIRIRETCFLGESNSVSSRTENFNWRYARCLEKDSSQRR